MTGKLFSCLFERRCKIQKNGVIGVAMTTAFSIKTVIPIFCLKRDGINMGTMSVPSQILCLILRVANGVICFLFLFGLVFFQREREIRAERVTTGTMLRVSFLFLL